MSYQYPPNVMLIVGEPLRYRNTFFRACMWATVGLAWAEPRMLSAVEMSGRV
jgi:hypothetical protein